MADDQNQAERARSGRIRRVVVEYARLMIEEEDHPPTEAKRKLNPLGSFVFRFVIYGLLSTFILGQLDLFGAQEVMSNYSRVVANRVFGPAYADGKREDISVVLISDHTIKQLDTSWPPYYAQHAEILELIRRHQPKAVMVDLLFVDERDDPTMEALTDVIARYDRNPTDFAPAAAPADVGNADPIPLYFAAPPAASELTVVKSIRNAVAESASAQFVSVQLVGDGTGNPYHQSADVVIKELAASLEYRSHASVSGTLPGEEAGPAQEIGTAAFRIARNLEVLGDLGEPPFLKDMPSAQLFWGTDADRFVAKWQTCRHPPAEEEWVTNRLLRIGQRLLVALFRPGQIEETCAFIPSLDAVELIGRHDPTVKERMTRFQVERAQQRTQDGTSPVGPDRPNKQADDVIGEDDDVVSLIKDRIVFYGADVVAVADRVVTPTHGVEPAIYVHAVALDNLLNFKTRYLKAENRVWGVPIDTSAIEYLLNLLTAAMALAFWTGVAISGLRQEPLKMIGLTLLMLVNVLGLYVAVGASATIFLDLSPINWIGLLSLFGAIMAFARMKPIEKMLLRLFGWQVEEPGMPQPR